jgi:hypothetical protein
MRDDDRPPVRRHRLDEADEPRRRRRRDDERSPRRDRKPTRRIPPAALAAIGLGFFVLLLGVGIAIYLLASNAGKPKTDDLMAHAPSDALVLSGYDFEELGDNEAFRKAMERRAPPDIVELDRAGLRTADLSRVLIARTVNNGNTCAIRFKVAPDKSRYLQANMSGRSYAPFTSLTGNYKFGYFADAHTLVLADRETAIQALLEKGKGRVSSDLQAMVDKVRGPMWRASGRLSANDFQRLGIADDGFSLRVGPSLGTSAWLVPSGRTADVRMILEFESENQAKQSAATLKSAFLLQRGLNEFGQLMLREGTDPADASDIRRGYEEADVSHSNNRVTASLRLPASEALRAVGSIRY